jgi:hypothetical protein
MCKVLHIGLWWPSLFSDAKEYCKWCDVCQCIKKPAEEMNYLCFPLQHWSHLTSGPLTLWAPSVPPHVDGCMLHHYNHIIFDKMGEAVSSRIVLQKQLTWFIFENVITRFGCPKVLMSDQGITLFE